MQIHLSILVLVLLPRLSADQLIKSAFPALEYTNQLGEIQFELAQNFDISSLQKWPKWDSFILCYQSQLNKRNGFVRPYFTIEASQQSNVTKLCADKSNDSNTVWHGIALRLSRKGLEIGSGWHIFSKLYISFGRNFIQKRSRNYTLSTCNANTIQAQKISMFDLASQSVPVAAIRIGPNVRWPAGLSEYCFPQQNLSNAKNDGDWRCKRQLIPGDLPYGNGVKMLRREVNYWALALDLPPLMLNSNNTFLLHPNWFKMVLSKNETIGDDGNKMTALVIKLATIP